MPIIEGLMPVNSDALHLYGALMNNAALSADVRDTCVVALQAVGRSRWDQHHQDLALAKPGEGDFDRAVNCYVSVIKWAVMSGALSVLRAGRFCQELSNAASTVDGANKTARQLIHSLMPVRGYVAGENVPLGAIVYHGARDNAIAHVTLHVGNGMVVGCWAAAYLQSAALRTQFESLIDRGWLGDTMLTPIDAFGADQLDYSLNPFWQDLPV